jgi:hypothetical protein
VPRLPSNRTTLVRFLISAALVVTLALVLAACGSGSSSSSAAQAGQGGPGGRGGFMQDPKVAACLKKQGIQGRGRPGGGSQRPPGGGPGAPGGQNSAQFKKFQDALKKCGVTPPNGNRAPS